MKKAELTERENEILKKITYIESCGNILKSKLSLEHTRHRSVDGYFMHVFSVIAAYAFYKQNTFATLFFLIFYLLKLPNSRIYYINLILKYFIH